MKKIFLYGIANAEDAYRVVMYSYIEDEFVSIRNLIIHASWMRFENPSIDHVYAIDNRKGLAYDYRRTIKQNTIESNVSFKDILEREGLLII